MEFKTFCIRNFKSISALVYEPEHKVLAITGHNGKGKTSFKEALFAALTGVFPDNAITEGAETCAVELVLPDETIVSRVINRSSPNYVTVNGKKVTAKSLNELFESRTGLDKDTFKVISSAENIEKLSSAELGTLMLAAIPEKLDIKKVLGYAGTIPAETEDILKNLFPAMPEEFSMSKVNEIYDSAFEQRKFLKKTAMNIKAKIDTFYLNEPERKLEEIEKDLEDILKKEATASSKSNLLKLYNAAVKNREAAEANIARLEREISENKATRPIENDLKKIEAEISEMNSKLINARSLTKTLNDNIAVFENTLTNIGSSVCPLSEKLVCTTDKTKVKEELEEMIQSNKEGIEFQNAVIADCESKLMSLNADKKAYNDNAVEYNKKVLLSKQIDELRKALPVVPEKPDVGRVEDFSAQKTILKQEQNHAKAWEQHLKDLDNYELASKEADNYDSVCKLLEPKGVIVSNIMDYYLKVFETVFNTRANELRPGMEIRFMPIDGVSYKIKTNASSPFKCFDSLSSGEKGLVSFLLIDMFNQLSNQRIMLLDDIDKLDKEAFEQIMKIIMTPAMQDSYDNILILGVDHEDIQNVLAKYSSDIDTL